MTKILTIKLKQLHTEEVIECSCNDEVLTYIHGEMKEQLLKKVAQDLVDKHQFTLIDLDPQIDMKFIYGVRTSK